MIAYSLLGRSILVNSKRLPVIRTRVVNYAKSAKEEQAAFWAKNNKLKRPMSPHLTIYRLPLTANMSIMHRATGGIQSGVLITLGLSSLLFAGKFESTVFPFLQEMIHPHVAFTLKVILALPFVYHTLTGIRHLIWDSGKLLALPALYKSGYTIIPIALLGSVFLATR